MACIVLLASVGTGFAADPRDLLPGLSGADDREVVDTGAWPWSALGRVNRGTLDPRQSGFCTGTLVAASTVLTAAHCLVNRRTFGLLPPDTIHFVAGWQRGTYGWHARAREIVLPAELRASADLRRITPQLDWALLILDGVPPDVRPVPISPAFTAGPVVQAGYSQDRGQVVTSDRTCQFSGRTDGLAIVTSCNVTRGDSGSPFFSVAGGDYAIVGILTSVHRNGTGWEAVALSATVFKDAILDRHR